MFLNSLLNSGIPKCNFIKNISKSTNHKSDHEIASLEISEQPAIIDIDWQNLISSNVYFKENPSIFLVDIQSDEYQIMLSSETTISSIIRNLLRDIVHIIKKLFPGDESLELEVIQESSVSSAVKTEQTTSLSKSFLRPDYWVIKKKNGRPIFVIEAKSPNPKAKANVLDDPHVHGEIYDFLLQLQAFYGQQYIFGLISTLDEWRFIWLPNSSTYCFSNSLALPPSETFCFTADRKVIGGPITSHTNPELIKVLISVILKAWYSPIVPIHLFSSGRTYLICNRVAYEWTSFTTNEISNETISLIIPPAQTQNFIVLRYFHSGGDGDVFLGISSSKRICVIKHFYESIKQEREYYLWSKLYNVPIFKKELSSRPSLIMPYVFHVQEKEKELSFNFDIRSWSLDSSTRETSTLYDTQFEYIRDRLEELALGLSPQIVAINAITDFAMAGYQHDDLYWRHVALLPHFDNSTGDIISLQCILIDLSNVSNISENNITEQEAIMNMLAQLDLTI